MNPFSVRDRLCDKCLAMVERLEAADPAYGILYPDLCPACQKKMMAWAEGLIDLLEETGAPPLDFFEDNEEE